MSATILDNELIPATAIATAGNDRQSFDPAELASLADSINTHGLAQPPTVRRLIDGFEIVAGERRIRAMRDVLGWSEIPCQVRDLSELQAASIMLAENLHRADLDAIEEARAYQSRIERFGSSIAEVATLANVPTSRVRARVALLRLCPAASAMVASKSLPLRFAGVMVDLDTDRQHLALAAYGDRPLTFEVFSAICSRLMAEQNQESMFDPATFLQIESFVDEVMETVKASTTIDEMEAEPVGSKDIAKRLGVKQQTVATWRHRGIFPEPRWWVSDSPVWQWSDVAAWAANRPTLKKTSAPDRS